MTGVHEALRAIRPDILIEFRQRYIGPGMRAFGNMFRVSDCPGDLLRNRVGVVDLRLLSGSTAVHGDPIVWNPEESCENAALQLLSVLFGVVQFSVRPQELDADKRRMVDFWLSYMRENRSVLLGRKLRALSPHLLYPAVWADGENSGGLRRSTIRALCSRRRVRLRRGGCRYCQRYAGGEPAAGSARRAVLPCRGRRLPRRRRLERRA